MPARRTSVAPAATLTRGLDALRAEAKIPTAFPPAVQAEAEAAAAREPAG